jgi:hypothetical protein
VPDILDMLKHQRQGLRDQFDWARVTGEDLDAIIAALEDRDRLREALTQIRDYANRLLERDEQNHRLRDIAKWAHRALDQKPSA